MHRSIMMSVCALALAVPQSASAEWINRYPRVSTLPLQVYLEGYNLPTFATSPTDPAPSPDGKSVAFAARGWLWIMDIATREARRVTRGASVDARPTWSPDGHSIAFMRDSGRDTGLWLLDVASGRERVLVDTPTIELDPAFSPDGKGVYYSSAEAGDLDIWRIDLASGAKTRLTTAKGQEINPQPVTGGLVYVSEPTLLSDTVEMLSFADGSTKILRREGLSPQLRISASPDGRSFALTPLAGDDRTQLLVSNADGGETLRLANDATYPVTPAWGRDGIWYVQPDRDERFRLYRVAVTGGPAEEVTPLSWTMGAPTARVTIRTRRDGAALPARLAVVDGAGHPAAPEIGNTTFDGQHGRISFHSQGAATIELPAGEIAIIASHGLEGAVTTRRNLRAGENVTIDIDLPKPAFDAAGRGWFSGDLHSHLNYGGPFQLEPDDLVSAMRAEALDVSTPMLANLQTALTDVRFWGWQRTERPFVKFSQEVRSHFLGHIGVIGADAPHTPFFFGPGYPAAYERLDLANSSPLRFARAHGGMNIYVHPVIARDPFPQSGPPAGIPLELVPDALAGEVDAIELACLWTDELGTAELWYRLLNLGLTIAPTGGSDTMHNLHRTMAVGSTRVYAKPREPLGMASFLDAVRAGRSFVTNGPMIDFTAGDAGPGAAIPGGRRIPFAIDAFTTAPVDHVEILVNGRVVRSYGALEGSGRYAGEIDVPMGGWIAARIRGGAPAWPSQDSYQFAHSAPIWLGARGSRDPAASQAAASDLLRWMDVADARLKQGYGGEPTAKLRARFAEGRARLMELAR
ncbi:CehA/McbA family metallohydrolase [Sphingomonas colocasiae]|uniref:CehA/McbA family metallohydrolase n=1 Tax=Sphingomonas colocasiae TaxID=1848973 RepID=A0ABS7PSD4_9SPHN|nr:CehA/McbA family metallohydrolase [Sphingomonas colocasiae]MBY8824133.1 CehA/McbA family metallohydrolase [Sphingomonas colocasiae]